jgi:hypothetical protein
VSVRGLSPMHRARRLRPTWSHVAP